MGRWGDAGGTSDRPLVSSSPHLITSSPPPLTLTSSRFTSRARRCQARPAGLVASCSTGFQSGDALDRVG